MKILWKRGEIAPKEQFLLFSTLFCCLLVDLCIKTGTRFSLRDKRVIRDKRVRDNESRLFILYFGDIFHTSNTLTYSTSSVWVRQMQVHVNLSFTLSWLIQQMANWFFFPEKRIGHVRQIISIGDNLQMEPICMKSEILFPEKNNNKKRCFKMTSAEIFTQSA